MTETTNPNLAIRPAKPGDEDTLLELIHELAVYEKAPEEAVATPKLIDKALFGDQPTAEAVIAEWQEQPAGFALFFHNFSTWLGKPGLYLEDLFVRENMRGKGIGKALLLHLAGIARDRDCGRMEWSVLDWNKPMFKLSYQVGAKTKSQWVPFQLDLI